MTQPLFTPPNRGPGRHEKALDRAITAAHNRGLVEDLDEALVSLARASAWALDQAEADGKPYAVASISAPYRECLAALQLTPADRKGAADDALNAALAELGTLD